MRTSCSPMFVPFVLTVAVLSSVRVAGSLGKDVASFYKAYTLRPICARVARNRPPPPHGIPQTLPVERTSFAGPSGRLFTCFPCCS